MKDSSKLHIFRGDYASWMGYAGYASGSVIIPMLLVTMSGELKFDLASGGALHLIRSTVMIVSMVLSGWAASLFGKQRTLGTSMVLIASGLLICSFASAYWMLAGAIVLIGLGNGFFESLATGFTQDLHAGEKNPGRYINITHSFWPLGILLTAIGSGIWQEYGCPWRNAVLIISGFILIPALLYLIKSRKKAVASANKIHFKPAIAPLKNPRFLLFLAALFLSGGSEHCFTFWIPSLMEKELGAGGFICGTAAAIFAAGMFIGRLCGGISGNIKPAKILTVCALICAMTSLLIPFINSSMVLLAILLLLGTAIGPLWPTLQYYCASTLKEYDSTQLYILMPLFGIPGCGFCTWLLGIIAGHTGLRAGFFIVFFCNLLIALMILILVRMQHKKEEV